MLIDFLFLSADETFMEASFSGGFVFNTQAEMEVRIADGSPSSTESITFPVLGIQDGGLLRLRRKAVNQEQRRQLRFINF